MSAGDPSDPTACRATAILASSPNMPLPAYVAPTIGRLASPHPDAPTSNDPAHAASAAAAMTWSAANRPAPCDAPPTASPASRASTPVPSISTNANRSPPTPAGTSWIDS